MKGGGEINSRGIQHSKGGIVMITKKQMGLIWVLAKQLDISRDGIHELIQNVYGKASLTSLTKNEAKTIIDRFIQDGAKVTKKRAPRRSLPSNVVELVTHRQVKYISILEEELGWHGDPARLKGFLKRTIKTDTVRTKKQGIKVIQGLKSMIERDNKRRQHGKHYN